MSKELDELCGKNVSLILRLPDISGFVWGRLSTDYCANGDYAVESPHCQSRVIFNESQFDHLNIGIGDPMVFIGLSDDEIDGDKK